MGKKPLADISFDLSCGIALVNGDEIVYFQKWNFLVMLQSDFFSFHCIQLVFIIQFISY